MVANVQVCKLTKETRWVCIPTFRYLPYFYLLVEVLEKKMMYQIYLFTENTVCFKKTIINLHPASLHKAIIPVSNPPDKKYEVKSDALLSYVGR